VLPPLAAAHLASFRERDTNARLSTPNRKLFQPRLDLVKNHFWLTVGGTFLIHLIAGAVAVIPLVGLALTLFFIGGLDWMFLKLIRGQRRRVGDAFAGLTWRLDRWRCSVSSHNCWFPRHHPCILPGIYLSISWMFFTPLAILDKRLDFWQAMELSRRVVTRHWWQVFGFALVCLLLMICGGLLCGVGVFIAMPIVKAATVYAYEDIFSVGPTLSTPSVPTASIS